MIQIQYIVYCQEADLAYLKASEPIQVLKPQTATEDTALDFLAANCFGLDHYIYLWL